MPGGHLVVNFGHAMRPSPRLSGLACGLALLLVPLAATGRGADTGAFTPEKAELLRQARTVALEIKQDWPWLSAGEADEGDTEEKKETGTAVHETPPRDLLPLAEYTTQALEFAGWKVVGPGQPAEMKLVIETYGRSLGGEYVGTVTGYHHSGAELSGSVNLIHQGQDMIYEDFSGKIPPPSVITQFYWRQQDAPFGRLLPDYLEAVYKMEAAVFGLAPLMAGLKKAEDEHRTAAARVLFARGEAAATPALIELLQSGDENLRTIAATALGVFGEAAAFPALLAALRDDPGYPAKPEELSEEQLTNLTKFDYEAEKNSDTRRDKARDISALDRHEAVQWALLQNPAPDKVRRLAALLRDRQASPMARRGAALVLGPLKDPVAGEALLAALRDDSFIVRAAAGTALNQPHYHEQRPVADALLAMADDPQPFARGRARTALGDFADEILGRHVRTAYGRNASVIDHRASCLAHPDPLVRLGAVRSSRYADEMITAALGRLLQSDPVPAVREAVVEILVEQLNHDLDPVIALALADTDAGTRRRALEALAAPREDYGDEEKTAKNPLPASAAAPLLALLDVDFPPETAWDVLKRVEGGRVNAVLFAAAQREGAKPLFREIVVIELAQRGDRRATPLITALLNRAGELRHGYLLVEAAAKLDDPALLDPLFTVMRQGAPTARLLAVRILGQLSHTRSVGPLIAILRPAEEGNTELAGSIREALRNLTGQDHGGSNGWLRWWKENAGKPVVRPAPKNPPETAPAEESADEKSEEPRSG